MTAPTIPVTVDGIPEALKAEPRWVLWKFVRKEGARPGAKPSKVPFNARTGKPAKSTGPDTWASWDEVASRYLAGGWSGVGFVLGDGWHGIDVDACRDLTTGELSPLGAEILDRVDGYAEVSPSGTGFKMLLRGSSLDGAYVSRETGLELYTTGRYFALTGAALPDHWDLAAEAADLTWLTERMNGFSAQQRTVARTPVLIEGELAEPSAQGLANIKLPVEGWTAARIKEELLPWLDPELHYDDWVGLGAALYHQFEGSEEGFDLWDAWSSESPKYGGSEYGRARWDSFAVHRSTGRGSVTLRSWIKRVNEARESEARAARDVLIGKFTQAVAATADARDLQEKVAVAIARESSLSAIERELLAGTLQTRARELGARLPIAAVRGWLQPRSQVVEQTAPAWLDDWVYVTDGDKFLRLSTKHSVTSRGFGALYDRAMPLTGAEPGAEAVDWALTRWGCPVVAHTAYMPSCGAVFELFGLQWANLYRPEAAPVEVLPEEWSEAEREAVGVVADHFARYLPDARERGLLLAWLAFCVQRPGAKIRWSPYIHGVPGDGKSFFGELVAVAMGPQNVRSLNGATLESAFTDWATGFALVVVEEMKQHGHNRHDIMNKIKPFITNTSVEVHPKGKASYTAPNVSNYLVLSNYLDGAPVDAGDRRYMFLSSALGTVEVGNLSRGGYFDRLFGALYGHAGAIRGWLLGVDVGGVGGGTVEFDADGRAPDTEVKRTVIEMSRSELDAVAEDLLDRGGRGIVGRSCRQRIWLTRWQRRGWTI